MSDRLEACPFCGGEATREFFSQNTWAIFCDGCHASAKMCDTKAEAEAAWNTRTPPASVEIGEALERLQAFADCNNIWEAYHDFPHPMHTMAGDLRAVLPALRALKGADA